MPFMPAEAGIVPYTPGRPEPIPASAGMTGPEQRKREATGKALRVRRALPAEHGSYSTGPAAIQALSDWPLQPCLGGADLGTKNRLKLPRMLDLPEFG